MGPGLSSQKRIWKDRTHSPLFYFIVRMDGCNFIVILQFTFPSPSLWIRIGEMAWPDVGLCLVWTNVTTDDQKQI